MKHLFIINPAAGSRNQTEIYRKKIAEACEGNGIDYSVEISAAPGQCQKIARRAAESGEELLLPALVKDYSAGWDWAGNSGKLIAHLLFKPHTHGETYTVYSGHGMTWGEVGELYQRLTGVKLRWCSEEEYLAFHHLISEKPMLSWAWKHDRRYNRDIDCSKILAATGLTRADFATPEEGLIHELKLLGRYE